MTALFWAFALGFAGSFHCIGMCGPIALALPIGTRSMAGKLASILLYNAGRIFTYSILGLLFGFFGRGLSLIGLQQTFSIILGTLIIMAVIFRSDFMSGAEHKLFPASILVPLKKTIQKFFKVKSLHAFFLIGILNGLLPCGFVFMALPMAMATGHSTDGMFFMALFGAGTLPAMLLVSYSHHLFSVSLRSKVRRILPVFTLLLGILLVVRGLNLGIPYISPECDSSGHMLHSCCKKHL